MVISEFYLQHTSRGINFEALNYKIKTMKTNNTILCLLVAGIFLSTTGLAQRDSVRVRTTTTETITSGNYGNPTTVTPVPASVPAPTPATVYDDNRSDENPNLRKTEIGFRYYPTFSAMKVRTYNGEVAEGSITMSNGFGAFIGHNFNSHVGVILEVDYIQMSQKYRDANLDRVVNLSYLNIPVLLSLNTDKTNWVNWNFVVGPQFGLNIGSSVKTDGNANGDTLRAIVAVKQGDIGLAYGTGLEFALNRDHTFRFDIGFRGFYGLVDMDAKESSSTPDTYNVMLKAARKFYAGYVGIAFVF